MTDDIYSFAQTVTKQTQSYTRITEYMDVIKSIMVWVTGISFLLITFPLTLLIWLLSIPFDRDRKIVHRILVTESYILSFLIPIWKINIEGREKITKDSVYIIISNHQSLLDILLINCLRYRFKWVSKIETKKIPFIGWYLKMADYIVIDRGNEESKVKMLERSRSFLKKGISVMLFPEGTRSLNNEIGFFKRGAFQLALETNVAILPVLIDGTGGILPKHGMIFGSGHNINIRVMDPVYPVNFETDNPDILSLKLSSLMKSGLQQLRAERHKK